MVARGWSFLLGLTLSELDVYPGTKVKHKCTVSAKLILSPRVVGRMYCETIHIKETPLHEPRVQEITDNPNLNSICIDCCKMVVFLLKLSSASKEIR